MNGPIAHLVSLEDIAWRVLRHQAEVFDLQLIMLVRTGHRGPLWFEAWGNVVNGLLTYGAKVHPDLPTPEQFNNGHRWTMAEVTDEIAQTIEEMIQ